MYILIKHTISAHAKKNIPEIFSINALIKDSIQCLVQVIKLNPQNIYYFYLIEVGFLSHKLKKETEGRDNPIIQIWKPLKNLRSRRVGQPNYLIIQIWNIIVAQFLTPEHPWLPDMKSQSSDI